MARTLWTLAVAALLAACGDDPAIDAGVDAGGVADAGPVDAGPTPSDAGPPLVDAGFDAGPGDAGPPAPAALEITPATHDFGSVGTGGRADMTFTVRNVGGWQSDIILMRVAGADPEQYTIADDGCLNARLGPGAQCVVQLAYTPTVVGTHAALLEADAGPMMFDSAAATGVATAAPILEVAPATHDFGNVLTGTSSAAVDFTVSNVGPAGSAALSHAFGGSGATHFEITASTCDGASLPIAGSCVVSARFNATTLGLFDAALDVTDGARSASAALQALSYSDACAVEVMPAAQSFGLVPVGMTGTPATLTARNDCPYPLGPVAVTLTGPHAGDFAVTVNTCMGSLAPSSACAITVEHSPTATGLRTARVEVEAPPGPLDYTDLSGTGT